MAPAPQADKAWKIIDEDLKNAGVPLILNLAEAAEVAGKNPKVLAKLAREGILGAARTPTRKGKGPWRILRPDLAIFLAGLTPEGGAR